MKRAIQQSYAAYDDWFASIQSVNIFQLQRTKRLHPFKLEVGVVAASVLGGQAPRDVKLLVAQVIFRHLTKIMILDRVKMTLK